MRIFPFYNATKYERGHFMNIRIDKVSMTYKNGKHALRDVSLELSSPNLIGLLGPNGAGKTTLMKLLVAGLLPTKGGITVDGTPLLKQERALKYKLGYLPQDFGLYDELTVWQFLDYIAALKGISRSKQAIERAIRDTNLEGKKRIRTLSGGQRQRVGIAQALLSDPQLLILDEPTVGLDPEERINFRNLFSRTAKDRIVLLSTHIIEDVQSVCNQLIVINNGQVLFSGIPSDLVRMAQGHVGIVEDAGTASEGKMHITSRVTTTRGVVCRVVADVLPAFARQVEPTLEDAYMHLLVSGKTTAASGAVAASRKVTVVPGEATTALGKSTAVLSESTAVSGTAMTASGEVTAVSGTVKTASGKASAVSEEATA